MHAVATPPPSRIRALLRLTERPDVASLAGGLPAPERLPTELVAAAIDRALALQGPSGPVALQYAPTDGVAPLRAHLQARFGVGDDELLVTTGSQQALDLFARTHLAGGGTVVVEDPTYLGALQAFRFAGADVVGIPGDADGLDVEALAERLAAGLRPRAVYVVGSFANPTGATLASARRRHLLELADGYGFLIVCDDPYVELRYDGVVPDSLGGPGRPVVTLGSASKVLAPGLRVGWASGPAESIGAMALAKQAADLHTSALDQLVVHGCLTDPGFADHLASTIDAYRARRDALADALRAELPDLEFDRPEGGMFLWARLAGVDADGLLDRALDHGVAFVPGSAFAVAAGTHQDRLRLGFATLDPVALAGAARRLAAAVRGSAEAG